MKKILLILLVFPITLSAQYALADFVVINEGMDADYHKLEKVWGAWHQNSIDKGEKTGWAVWKRTPNDNDDENAAHYVVFNQFSSKEKMEDYINGGDDFSINSAISTMKSKLKGMSTSSIRKIVQSEQKIKRQVRSYTLQIVDATPLVGGDIKIGDKMSFATMSQKEDDYEEYESNVWKPYFLDEVMRNNHRWWALTKIVDRNENAYKKPSHLVWNIGVENPKEFLIKDDFISNKMRGMMDTFREMGNAQELTLIYKTN
jgi:hypothetical protein|tara:strand:+ start:114 stop:890 length:777 start_codon:yes stop_codon:yes gene_type:complete